MAGEPSLFSLLHAENSESACLRPHSRRLGLDRAHGGGYFRLELELIPGTSDKEYLSPDMGPRAWLFPCLRFFNPDLYWQMRRLLRDLPAIQPSVREGVCRCHHCPTCSKE